MASLTQLPPEILHEILGYVAPEDLGPLLLTCRRFHNFVAGNSSLCKAIYLHHLDEPPTADLAWESELHDLVALKRICSSRDANKKSHLPFVHATVTRLLRHSARHGRRASNATTHPPSRNAGLLAALLDDEANRAAFLCRSFLFERARGLVTRFQDPPRPEHQLGAHLHCLYGKPVLRCGRTRGSRLYPFACSKVYDLRQYTSAAGWGPFRDDASGRVDWEKVEAVLLVLRSNIQAKGLDKFRVFANLWNTPFAGSWPQSYLPMPARGAGLTDLDRRDPYSVAGTWLRVVCFLDYSDFINYNFPVADGPPDNVPRPALDVGEATRLILMKIHVTAVEPPGEDDGQELPVVHFRGFSRSLDGALDENANSDLRGEVNTHGTCRLTREGEVRWTTWSIFGGQERWRSESVQVGGVRSARGVVGNWFDRNYDPHGPCGPTAFWKISDRESEAEDARVGYHDFLPLLDGAEPDDYDDDYEPGGDEEEEDDDDEGENEDEEEGELQDVLFPAGMQIFNLLSDSE